MFSKLHQEDHKTLRVVCAKFEEILNPIVFQRARISKARVDRLAFWGISSTPKLAAHVKELVWFELAEDESVFMETAHDAMPRYRPQMLRESILHDNYYTLPDLSDLAADLFWLPSTPKQDDPQRDGVELRRSRILNDWRPIFYRGLEALPKLETFTSRPMPAYHVLSRPTCAYKFVAYLFQMDIRSNIQGYQRNDGLFSVLLPAMEHLRDTIKHLHWADEAYGESSSIKRIRFDHCLSFKYLKTIDLCLSLPSVTRLRRPWSQIRSWVQPPTRTCWQMLGGCLHSAPKLEEISLCFEMADPKVGLDALIDALDECLFCKGFKLPNGKDNKLPSLKRMNLRDGPSRRVALLGRFCVLDVLLGRFLVRHGETLRHLSFRRWFVSQNLLHRLAASKEMKLESFEVDNTDFYHGASIPESALLAFVNGRAPRWPLPMGEVACKSAVGDDDDFMETPGISDWANPKFASVPQGMDYCAAILGGTTPATDQNDNEEEEDDDEDKDFEPSECTDAYDSDFYSDSEVDSDGDIRVHPEADGDIDLIDLQSVTSGDIETSNDAGTS